MISKKILKETKVIDTIEYVIKNGIVAVNISKKINTGKEKLVKSFFIDEEDMPKKDTDFLDKYDELCYQYYKTKDIDIIRNNININTDKELLILIKAKKQDAIKILKGKKISKKNLIRVDYYDYSVYSMDHMTALPCRHFCSYIGGVTDKHFDLDKAYNILRESKFVAGVKKINIPYYNQEENFSKAIEFYFTLDQKTFDEIIKFYSEQDDNFHPSDVYGYISGPNLIKESFDPLGLKEALKEPK